MKEQQFYQLSVIVIFFFTMSFKYKPNLNSSFSRFSRGPWCVLAEHTD